MVVLSGKERTGIDVLEWAARGVAAGAGEILLTSWDRDGTRSGYDLELLSAVSRAVTVPVIASGGATRRWLRGASIPIHAADVSLNTLKVQETELNSKWWVTAWEKPLLFYLCLMHFGAVAIDTTFSFHWGIPKLPSPYDTYQGVVLLSDVVVMSTAGLTQKVVASIWK